MIARLQTPRFGVNIVAIAPHQGPFQRGQAHLAQHIGANPKIEQLAHGIGLQVDAHAQRLDLGHRLEHGAGHTDLMQRQRQCHAANATACD